MPISPEQLRQTHLMCSHAAPSFLYLVVHSISGIRIQSNEHQLIMLYCQKSFIYNNLFDRVPVQVSLTSNHSSEKQGQKVLLTSTR